MEAHFIIPDSEASHILNISSQTCQTVSKIMIPCICVKGFCFRQIYESSPARSPLLPCVPVFSLPSCLYVCTCVSGRSTPVHVLPDWRLISPGSHLLTQSAAFISPGQPLISRLLQLQCGTLLAFLMFVLVMPSVFFVLLCPVSLCLSCLFFLVFQVQCSRCLPRGSRALHSALMLPTRVWALTSTTH